MVTYIHQHLRKTTTKASLRFVRDATIISITDMLTSFLAGFTIFSILGNLAHELDTTVDDVIKGGGTSLAFISYPQALANFPAVPQVRSGHVVTSPVTAGASDGRVAMMTLSSARSLLGVCNCAYLFAFSVHVSPSV